LEGRHQTQLEGLLIKTPKTLITNFIPLSAENGHYWQKSVKIGQKQGKSRE
jgi:hypothetical protein